MSREFQQELLDFLVLRFGFFQNGDIGIGVFPECKELFVVSESTIPGQVGIGSEQLWACHLSSRGQSSAKALYEIEHVETAIHRINVAL